MEDNNNIPQSNQKTPHNFSLNSGELKKKDPKEKFPVLIPTPNTEYATEESENDVTTTQKQLLQQIRDFVPQKGRNFYPKAWKQGFKVLGVLQTIIDSLPKGKTKYRFGLVTLCAVFNAITRKLYNDSFQAGYEDINGGLFGWKEPLIQISMREIIKYGYGLEISKSNAEQREQINACIEFLQNNDIHVPNPNSEGGYDELRILPKCYTERGKTLWERVYNTYVNPVIANLVVEGFRFLPQDFATESLKIAGKSRTGQDYLLCLMLYSWPGKTPWIRYFDKLADELRISDAYKKNKGRTSEDIKGYFSHAQEMGIIGPPTYEEVTTIEIDDKGNKRKRKVTRVTIYKKRYNPYNKILPEQPLE